MKLSRFAKHAFVFSMGLQFAGMVVHAAPALSFSVVDPSRLGAPGDVDVFQGTITNNTGGSLDSTDLFLNFSGYDPANVTLDQLLGGTSFSIANGATSGAVDLFTFTLAGAAHIPETYPAEVILEDFSGDLSAVQTVSVTTTPEPASLPLLAAGSLALALGAFRKRIKKLPLPIAAIVVIAPTLMNAQVSAVHFVTGPPGTADVTHTLMISLPVMNEGTVSATNVEVSNVTLRTATRVSPVAYPVTLGTIGPNGSGIFQATFSDMGLTQNTPYLLTVRGTYQVGGSKAGFTLNRSVLLPPASPGFGTSTTTAVPSNTVVGAPFPHQAPIMGDDVNETGPPVPTGPFVPGTPTPSNTSTFKAPVTSGIRSSLNRSVPAPQVNSVTFSANQGVGLTSAGLSCSPGTAPASCAEPSGATGGGVIFVTANWTAAYSTDGGSTFKTIDPTTVFPNDAVGFCCDQVVQYVPSVDRFFWLLQGTGYRLASASPADISSSGGTSWTYWNLTPSVFGTSGSGFDYPDLSVGTNSLYISWDANCSPSCNGGLQVARIPLTQLQGGGTIGIDYTNQSHSNLAWGSHLAQYTGGEIFWAGHNGTSQLRVFSWAEGSNTYFWRDIGISSWANNTLSSKTPDAQDWLSFGFPGNSIVGATRAGDQLWFAWTAGTDSNFQQPHVEMVTLDRSNNFNKTQQVQIWNNSYAFAYPALATNACTGEIGLSLQYGGSSDYENHVVGFWGDFEVYTTANSNVGENRFGDYVTIRQDPGLNGAFFDALGYGVNNSSGAGTQADVRRVVFGRGGACSIIVR